MRSVGSIFFGSLLLCSACSSGESSDSGSDTGGSSNDGTATGGGETGGSASGGEDTGGSASGGDSNGDGGAPPDGTGGFSNPLEDFPDWVPGCMQSRQLAPCPSCLDPVCIVCAWGSDAEVAAAGAACDAPVNYTAACSCAPCSTGNGACYQ